MPMKVIFLGPVPLTVKCVSEVSSQPNHGQSIPEIGYPEHLDGNLYSMLTSMKNVINNIIQFEKNIHIMLFHPCL